MKPLNEYDYQYMRDVALVLVKYQLAVWFWQYHFGPWLWYLLKVIGGKDGAV
jgi:hypothetical protein